MTVQVSFSGMRIPRLGRFLTVSHAACLEGVRMLALVWAIGARRDFLHLIMKLNV